MKFSYAIMNPPYDRNLHLKFLEKVIKVADKVVNISPVRWLQDPFAKYKKNSDWSKFRDSISKHIESLEIIPASKATKTFTGATFMMNLGIYVCTEQGGYDYMHTDPLIQKIIDKTMECNWETSNSWKSWGIRKDLHSKPYMINVGGIHGGGDDMRGVMNKTYESQCNVKEPDQKQMFEIMRGKTTGPTHFEFDTEEERRNFYDCYSTPFMKWHTSLWKSNPKIYCYKVPYFGDYTKPWTNARFCEWFGITGFVSDTEAEPGSEWETVLHCINNLNKQDKR